MTEGRWRGQTGLGLRPPNGLDSFIAVYRNSIRRTIVALPIYTLKYQTNVDRVDDDEFLFQNTGILKFRCVRRCHGTVNACP